MYMGVIHLKALTNYHKSGIPHVYGGDPDKCYAYGFILSVFPMYMGVILVSATVG